MSESKNRLKHIVLAWSVIPLGGCIFLFWILYFFGALDGDKQIYFLMQESLFLHVNAVLNHLPAQLWSNLTQLGDAIVLIPILSVFIVNKPRVWLAIILTSIIAGALSFIGKGLFQIPRPAAVLDTQLFTVIGELLTKHNSLPSGHSITIFAGISTLLIIFRYDSKRVYSTVWIFTGLLLAIAVGLSRVAVGAHWPFDFLLGAFLGWLAGVVGAYIYLLYFRFLKIKQNNYLNFFISFSLLGMSIFNLSKNIYDPYNLPIYLISSMCGLSSSVNILLAQLDIPGKQSLIDYIKPVSRQRISSNKKR